MALKKLSLKTFFGFFIVLIFVVFSIYKVPFFESIEKTLYDRAINLFASPKGNNQIILVNINDNSSPFLNLSGELRSEISRALGILKKNNAKIIGIQLPFDQKLSNQGLEQVKSFRNKFNTYSSTRKKGAVSNWVRDNLGTLEKEFDYNTRLAEALYEAESIILPFYSSTGKTAPIKQNDNALLLKNAINGKDIPESLVMEYKIAGPSLPIPDLLNSSMGLGYIGLQTEDHNNENSYPIYISYNGKFFPSFPLRIALAALQQEPKQVILGKGNLIIGGLDIPLPDGKIFLPFPKSEDAYTRYSLIDILNSKKSLPALKDKIVLIGLTATQDKTDLSASNGYDILQSARVIDSLLSGNPISRPVILFYLELLLLLLFGIFSAIYFPQVGHKIRLSIMLGLIIIFIAISLCLNSLLHIWFKPVYFLSAVIFIYLYFFLFEIFTTCGLGGKSTETNRMLGLNFQSQGLLDLAFSKFKKLPLDDDAKELIYNLGLEFERKRLINKALQAYEYLFKGGGFKDTQDRLLKLRESVKSSTIGSHQEITEGKITEDAPSRGNMSRIGRYKILGELGKGAMGLVFKAIDEKINRTLAIKTIRFSDEFDDDVIQEIKERFFREAEIAGKLSHPSIVTIYDVGEHGELTYMAMEFLDGDDLEKYISKKNLLPLRKVLNIVARVADALDFAHKDQVIHRDIKPANIMLLKNGAIKVTDFGIAKAISSSRTKTGVILGTPNYMSPEQIMGQKIDHRSDIFSLGVLFFQLLTGETPFHGDNLSNLLYQITQVKHPTIRVYNPKIPQICEKILDKALEKNPTKRFQSAGEMSRVIKTLIQKLDQLKSKKAGK